MQYSFICGAFPNFTTVCMCNDGGYNSGPQPAGKMAAVELRVYGRLRRHLSTHGRRSGHKTAKVNRCIGRTFSLYI